jgi:hypothetical protein
MPPPTSMVTRKRTRSTNVSESNDDHQQATSTSTIVPSRPTSTAPPKRQRNNPPRPNTNYSLRNRAVTPDARQPSTRLPSIDRSTNSHRYNLRPRTSQSHVRLPRVSTPHPTIVSHRTRRRIPSAISNPVQQEQPIPPVAQPRQFRLVYIPDDDDQPTTTTQPSPTIVNTTFSLVTDDEDDQPRRPQVPLRRTGRSTTVTGHNTR